MTGGALALALGAGVVLGTVPAQADWYAYPIQLRYHGSARPSDAAAQNETRSAADRECVAKYGFRARGVTPVGLVNNKHDGTVDWYQYWRCDSN
ncbi:hypothetical protein UK23_29350 [Lentzea aerocolonigenes]|uniref:Uncharacterized protein n=2 Tax=Lentzea aerocolonigenes TaxID=68170 RepID=A0A0F0GPD6_LENAE|nr:hypothetical protein UK23_29350 [Lentzea aerocolonigenes]